MQIELRFFAGLREYLPNAQNPCVVSIEDGSTVSSVLGQFGVPEDKPRILLVNGRHVERTSLLNEGDILAVFPPVAGG